MRPVHKGNWVAVCIPQSGLNQACTLHPKCSQIGCLSIKIFILGQFRPRPSRWADPCLKRSQLW